MSEPVQQEANVIVKMPRDLKKKYHKKCIDENTTMKDEMTTHIKAYIGDSL